MKAISRSISGWAVGLVSAAAILAAPAEAQIGILDHDCGDCHLRDHDLATGVSPEMSPERRVRQRPPPIIDEIFQNVSRMTALCLECHATPERRAMRAQASSADPPSVANGRYLDLDLSDDHPVSGDRGRSRWRSRSLTRGLGQAERPVRADERLVRGAGAAECYSCHDPHEAYDQSGDPGVVRSLCLSCHDPGYYAFDEHLTPSCVDCHGMHASPGERLLRTRDPDDLCSACHEGGLFFGDLRVDPALRGPAGHDEVQPGQCVECHTVHRSGAR